MTQTPGDVVRAFAAAMAEGDLDRALNEFAASDIVFENVPMEPPAQVVRGADVVRARLGALYQVAKAESFDIVRQVEQGEWVFHERVDSFRFPPGTFPKGDVFVMRVATVFHVQDGRIALWRDYYDFGCFERDLGVDLAEFGRRVGHAYTPA
ncbi:limonene-1,2-epoxide hydrolase family protein [Pseudofrankia asymbiotica]|uniref:Limonene-1,2-epoxide hydrolase domain-containing protein n=1 Tax=Pseudofrankia asymbiotica TaxID=1834516 RepID=A0A1V2I7K2_9ACTN|nr:limonene-1,2-epoxide hydrolase family protein [Pseudofrankia asymbiotica]ONH28020.1 hypothetical protein BL253_20665 [Pseudofrankia asymbiotica]